MGCSPSHSEAFAPSTPPDDRKDRGLLVVAVVFRMSTSGTAVAPMQSSCFSTSSSITVHAKTALSASLMYRLTTSLFHWYVPSLSFCRVYVPFSWPSFAQIVELRATCVALARFNTPKLFFPSKVLTSSSSSTIAHSVYTSLPSPDTNFSVPCCSRSMSLHSCTVTTSSPLYMVDVNSSDTNATLQPCDPRSHRAPVGSL